MDVIGPTEQDASNEHNFILVSIDYFTKWVEETSYRLVTKKVVDDFVHNNIICWFGFPESIIDSNDANLNSNLMSYMKAVQDNSPKPTHLSSSNGEICRGL